MTDRTQATFAKIPPRLSALGDIATNLWWSWHPAARMLYKTLDRPAWKESVHNPMLMLRDLPGKTLRKAAQNPEYLSQYDAVTDRFRRDMASDDGWFQQTCAAGNGRVIAYFSAEYGLHHSLPFYAGGLGFLAGDYIKECSDLRIPLVAIGFMYPEGYVRQRIREDGWQDSMEQPLNREASSIYRVLDAQGRQLTVRVPLIEPPLRIAVWRTDVGRIPLYLMDTDIEPNDPWNRGISARLYVGDRELRLRQEIVLGIGGSEVLRALGIAPSVVHLNEGHSAFALLEQIRARVAEGADFEAAAEQVRRTSVFTTHTPVPAGHDVFSFQLVEKYFKDYCPALKIEHSDFLKLGANPANPSEGFNMTALAMRLAGYRNGVSKRHGQESRRMWHSLWPDVSQDEVPICHITNGVHVPTWIEPKIELLLNKYLGPDWLAQHDDPAIWEKVLDIPDEELWEIYFGLKMKLINTVRDRIRQRWITEGATPSAMITGGTLLDPTVLTLGFARRFATYKRADLIFHDKERLKRMLLNRWRPIQIIFAGKAHPADDPGKRLIQKIYDAARNPEFGGRIAFVEDYGEQLAQYMVHGVDVWLNNPIPPMEACGTSGMKAALNGVPQLSILDGWWMEGFNGRNGWAFGDESSGGDRDAADSNALYDVLEREIIPTYYDTSSDGVPHDWVRMVKESMRSNAAQYSARRMVKDYANRFYAKAFQSV